MTKLLGMIYFLVGLLQFAAIVRGFTEAVGFVGVILAFMLAEVPILGIVMGIRGAVLGWGMPLGGAVLLFLSPYALMLLIGLLGSRE